MNDLVKTSIEGRKNAIFNSYNITDQSIIEKIENLFRRISEFGESCKDNLDFENKFASSSLNQEYIQLFTEIATTCTQTVKQPTENRHVKSDKEYAVEEVKSEIRYQTRNVTEPIRREIRQETYNVTRNMPIIGDILTAKQHIDLFNKFKRRKEKNENKKENTNGSNEEGQKN